MNTGFYTNPIYLEHDTGSHPENANRLRAIQEKLESEGLLERLILQSGRSATSQEIKLLHSEKLISAVEAAAESGARTLHTPDCIISAQTFNAAAHAVGSVLDGVIEVAERRLDNAFCAVRPPGHHAEQAKSMGFCLFNSIAVGPLLPLLRRRTLRLAPSRFPLRLWQPGREEGRRLLVQKHRRVVRPGLVLGRLGHHQSTEGGMHVLGRALAVAAAEGGRGRGRGRGGRGRR